MVLRAPAAQRCRACRGPSEEQVPLASQYTSNELVDVDCPQRACLKDVDWLAILDIWKANGQRGRYKGVWKVDNTEIADELQAVYDAAVNN